MSLREPYEGLEILTDGRLLSAESGTFVYSWHLIGEHLPGKVNSGFKRRLILATFVQLNRNFEKKCRERPQTCLLYFVFVN
jgi:hypothetical protein